MPETPPQTRPDFVCVSCHKKINPQEEEYLVEKKFNPALHRIERTGRYLHEECNRTDPQAGIWHRPEEPKSSPVY